MKKIYLFLILILIVPSIAFSQVATEAEVKRDFFTDTERTLRKALGGIFSRIEPFRIKQAVYFVNLRNEMREKVGINKEYDVEDIVPDYSEPAGTPEPQTSFSELQAVKTVHFGAYFTLIYATAFAALFSNVAVFYVALLLIILIVLRYIFGRLV